MSLWAAIRALEEGQLLMRKLAANLSDEQSLESDELLERATLLHQQSETLRQFVIRPVEPVEAKS